MSPYRPKQLTVPAPPPRTAATDAGRRALLRGSVLGATALGVGAAAAAPALAADSSGGVQGMDVSNWQKDVGWPAQRAAGARFAYVKATEGRSYVNPSFSSQYSGASRAGMLRGGYHFARPDTSGPTAQVEHFLAHGGGWTADGLTLPGLVDFEGYSGLPADYGLSRQALRSWISTFLTAYRDAVGRRPMIYTNSHWWDDVIGAWTPTNTPLMLAAYQSSRPTNLPGNWWAYEMWQYSETGPYAGDSIRWHGTRAQLDAFVTDKGYSARGI